MQEFLQLEDDSVETRTWVKAQNTVSTSALCDHRFEADRDALEAMFDGDDKLIVARTRGGWQYHFVINKAHKKGLLRRRKTDNDAWQPVFDVGDYCAQNEGEWEWRGASTCRWDPSRIMISLSQAGSDRVRIFEFDCDLGKQVEGGFYIPASKTHVRWAGLNQLLVSGGAQEGDGTKSGWPRRLRLWQRGSELADAPLLFEVGEDDLSVHGWCAGESDNLVMGITVRHSFSAASYYAGSFGDGVSRLDLPDNIDLYADETFLAFSPHEDGGSELNQWLKGSLVLVRHEQVFDKPFKFEVVFSPSARCHLKHFFIMGDTLIYSLANNLRPEVYFLDLSDQAAQPVRIEFPDGFEVLSVMPENVPDLPGGDQLLAIGQGPLQPPSLFRFGVGETPKLIDQAPQRFETEGLCVEVLEAESSDGEMIPYHLVRARGKSGPLPTLIYGYGGFAIGVDAFYSLGVGKLWLEHGNAYVIAHLRGGDEFGPAWHEAAKGPAKRQVSYEDMVAIARDLVRRGITTPKQTAVTGGSNGGLMAGVMLTQFPDDFGAVWSNVPVLDMQRFTKFEAGIAWMDEYGDPDKSDDWEKMKQFSPFHLVEKGRQYPPVFFTTSATDDRVHPSHARRMVAKMLDQGHSPLFFETSHGGHAGSSASKAQAIRLAMGYGFLRKHLA